MAARLPAVWGIDLGQSALKAIRLEMKDGLVCATAFEYIEHPKILSQPDADPDELSREALTQFLSRNKIKGDMIAIGVPGQSGLARFVKLPPVDEKKIADIVKFEAKQQIPFPLEEVVWDFQRLNKGDIIDGLALETEIGLFAMKRDMVTRAIRQFKEVNVEVHLVQMAPLALCNFLSYDLLGKGSDPTTDDGEDSNECVVALEIGTDNSNLVITNGGRIIWQRPIPIGGNHFTRALTKEMKLTFAKAEHLKRNAAKSPDLKKILSSLKQVLNDFVGEVQRSLGYFTNTHRNAQIQYMVGLGNAFRLPGLQKFLQEKLQLPVKKLAELERATGDAVTTAPTFKENLLSFGVAYGLALQGLKETKLQTNLLPYEVRLERVIRGKKPWAVAAAACLLFGMFVLAFARGHERTEFTRPEVKEGAKKLDSVIKNAKGLVDQANNAKGDLTSAFKTLDDMSGGVKERLNWQHLHQYVNMATPQPDVKEGGRRLYKVGVVNAKEKYGTQDAKEVADLFEKQKLNIVKNLTPADEKRIKQNLVQVNIVGINAAYSDDLLAYFAKIHEKNQVLFGMTEIERTKIKDYVAAKDDADKQKALPRAGWVVEVRGYSYHKDRENFINETILVNLANPELSLEEHREKAEVLKRIQGKVSYLNIYLNETDSSPKLGAFNIISSSYLRQLLGGGAGGGGGFGKGPGAAGAGEGAAKGGGPGPGGQQPGGPGPGGDAGQAAGDKKVDRSAWKPIGEVASRIFLDGGDRQVGNDDKKENKGFDPFGKKDGDKKDGPAQTNNLPPRTEFVILFVWQEPIAAQQPIDLGEKE